MEHLIDNIDRAILACLAEDARISLKVLSARVGLTSPSTAERVKRLEERGVIQGYGARVNLARLYPTGAGSRQTATGLAAEGR